MRLLIICSSLLLLFCSKAPLKYFFSISDDRYYVINESTAPNSPIARLTSYSKVDSEFNYSLLNNPGSSFSINNDGLFMLEKSISYEAGGNNVYSLLVEISNSLNSIVITITLEVIRQSAQFFENDYEIKVAENESVGSILGLVDLFRHSDDSLFFSPNLDSIFSIDTNNFIILKQPLDFENLASYYGEIYLLDSLGLVDSSHIKIVVTDSPGESMWKFQTGDYIVTSPLVTDNFVIFGSDDSSMYVLTRDGVLFYHYKFDNFIVSSPTLYQNNIYFGGLDSNLYSVNLTTGQLLWIKNLGGAIEGSPAISTDGRIYIATKQSKLFALTYLGDSLWSEDVGSPVRSSIALDEHGNLYVSTLAGRLISYSSNGNLRWSNNDKGSFLSSPTEQNGVVYVASREFVYAFDANFGVQKWSYPVSVNAWNNIVLDGEGNLYFGMDDRNFYSLNSNGQLRWKFRTEGEVRSSAFISKKGNLYFGSYDGYVYALQKDSGDFLWRYQTGGRIFSSPSIDEKGTLYVGSRDGILHAVETNDTSGLIQNVWSKYGRNLSNTF